MTREQLLDEARTARTFIDEAIAEIQRLQAQVAELERQANKALGRAEALEEMAQTLDDGATPEE